MLPPKISSAFSGMPNWHRLVALLWLVLVPALLAEAAAKPAAPNPFPDAGAAVFRMMGALMLVIALFFGGVWLYRNWQRVLTLKGKAPKLQVLEARTLGNRNSLYVVGYEQERLLIAASPTGIVLLSHLPAANPGDVPEVAGADKTPPSFAQALQKVLTARPS
jgi:flagellar biogenesis protein FliO